MNQNTNTAATQKPTIVALRSLTQSLLEPRLRLVFEAMADHLFNLSASAQLSSDNRSRSFEAFSLLQAQNKSLVKSLLERIDRGYERLIDTSSNDTSVALPTELDLVDLNEFESNLAIDRMVKSGNERYWLALEAITLRIAAVIDAEPKKIQLPFGLKVCFGGYRSVIGPLEFPEDTLTELDKAFARNLLPELGEIYQKINALLSAEGWLPNVEKELENSGSRLAAKAEEGPSNKPRSQGIAHSTQPDTTDLGQYQTPETIANSGAVSVHGGENLNPQYGQPIAAGDSSSTANMPGFLSDFPTEPSAGAPGMAAQSAPRTTADNNDSLSSQVYASVDSSALPLSPLDHEAHRNGYRNYLPYRVEHRPSATVGPGILNRLRSPGDYGATDQSVQSAERVIEQSKVLVDRLIGMRQSGMRLNTQSGSLVNQLDLKTEDPDTDPIIGSIALVDRLFDTLSTVVPTNPSIVNSLYSLKLPLAQLSLTEPDFYRDREHPARLLIERLTELGALTPEGNKRLEAKLTEVLEQLNADYDGTQVAFDKALNKVTELALGALRQQQRTIQRQVAAEAGREKRRAAQHIVAQGCARAMPQALIPRILADLLDSALRDGLVLRILRSGEDANYRDVLAALGRINSSLQGEQQLGAGEASEAIAIIQSSLKEAGLLNPDSEAALKTIVRTLDHGATGDLVASPYLRTDAYTEPNFSNRLESLPRLSRWIKRARELPINSWLSHTTPSGITHNQQLIWRNDAGTRFTLANEQGQDVQHLDLLTLARRLANRLQPLKTSDQLSIIERSVFTTLEDKQATLFSVSRAQAGRMLTRSKLVDKVQSMLRRARRRGPSHVAALIVTDEAALNGLVESLSNAGITVVEYGQVNDHRIGLIIDNSSSATVQNALNTLIDNGGAIKNAIALIEPAFKDAESVWQGLEDHLDKTGGEGSGNNEAIIIDQQARQKDLAAAVLKTYSQLCDDINPRFSLREIIRRGANDQQSNQRVFQVLLDGAADTGAEVARQSGYHSTALVIALDCAKIASVCQFADQLANAGREVPVFSIRIATDSALHHDFLEFVLKAVSDSGIGTDRLCIELRDSTRLREASRTADFARVLRSIGCQISIADVHPSRGSTAQLQALCPHLLILDASLWPPENSHLASLNQAISDLHHLVGEHVVLRDDRDTGRASELGIDLIESFLAPEIEPSQLIQTLPTLKR